MREHRLRTFIACELPGPTLEAIEQVQKQLKTHRFAVKWVRPTSIHLTLKFLGEIHAGQINAIGDAMQTAAQSHPPLQLAAKGIGVFPGIRRARVIWVGLSGQTTELAALQQQLSSELAGAGFKPEGRPFRGHLTLGRVKKAIAPQRLLTALNELRTFAGEPFTIDGITLFKSELKPAGAEYTALAQVPLSAPVAS